MSDTLKIKCNNVPREVLHWFDLSEKEKAEFGHLLDDEDNGISQSFFRYKGWVYDLSDFTCIERTVAPHPQRPGWERFHGYQGDSFFSGILIRYCDDFESVVVATYYA